MQLISYVKISNFKGFSENITIDFSQPSVLIGPNNSGKTSVLQALAMWSMGIKTWFREKGQGRSKSKMGTSINRLNITQVPIKESKYFWQNAIVRKGNINTELKITVGLIREGTIQECSIVFTYFNAESIYCFPDEVSLKSEGLLSYASTLDLKILYPMSGIAREEPLIAEGRIDVLVGQGQTAEVLRNICYKIIENDEKNETKDWETVSALMFKLFGIKLLKPYFNATQGTVELSYQTSNIKDKKNGLDIGLSGRGQQEMLLLIAYIFTHKNSILLLDEPDAHLEILRQKQVFSLLKHLAEQNGNQIIIATHSEVILNEAADSNLMLLIDGEAINLADKKTIKAALKDYGLEHYYKAKISKAVLYVEGSTDIEMLRAFAQKLKHPILEVLDGTLYVYYVSDNEPTQIFESELNKAAGYFTTAKKHFQAIQKCVPTLRGIGIFDNDNNNRTAEINDAFALLYWSRYEFENYFAQPYVVENYVINFLRKQGKTDIEIESLRNRIEEAINNTILSELLNDNSQAFEDYKKIPKELQKELFNTFLSNKKASHFLEICFKNIAKVIPLPILLNKGGFYQLIPFIKPTDIDKEITSKLDMLKKYLSA
jgi:ABC-type cobalamin/Fe3+-siderophores transport system ATPase subunit